MTDTEKAANMEGGAVVSAALCAPKAPFIIQGNARLTGHALAKAVEVQGNAAVREQGSLTNLGLAKAGGSPAGASATAGTQAGIAPAQADPAFAFRDLYVFPNPAKKTAPTIRVQVGMADSVEIRIYDMAGTQVHGTEVSSANILDDGNGKGPQYTYDYNWNVGRVVVIR